MKETLQSISTPALVLDIDQLDENIADIVTIAEQYGVSYRPHIKTHKSVDIAKRQLEAGAIGLTVAKVGEAEVMADAGVKDIVIAFPISAEAQLNRIQQLQEKSKITVAVDSKEQASILNTFFINKVPLHVWIKVNAGLNRCGVEPGGEVLELAKYVNELSCLHLEGLFTHAGHSYGASSGEQLKEIADEEVRAIVDSATLCEENGIQIEHRSVGSTPTFKFYTNVDGITEIRPGNAVFYDMVQVGLGIAKEEQCALTVLSSIASIKKDRFVIDAGSKTLALDKGAHGNDSISGHGKIIEHSDLMIERLSEEHGVIPLQPYHKIPLGERMTIIPNHACVVANLFDEYIVQRNGNVIEKWPVSARGKNN